MEGTRGERGRTFDGLAGLFVDDAPFARDGHHALHLHHILRGAVLLLERLPDLEQDDALYP